MIKILGAVVAALLAVHCWAQAHKPPGTPVRPGGSTAAEPSRGPALVRGLRIEFDKTKTPTYTVDASEGRSSPRDWGRITIEYETGADWHDEVEIRCYVATRDRTANQIVLFTGKAVYVDVPKGKHKATMFLTPNTIDRYGEIERAAAEIYIKGQIAGDISNPKTDQPWWRTAVTLKTIPDRLLERNKTPFAFVAIDSFEDIKTTP